MNRLACVLCLMIALPQAAHAIELVPEDAPVMPFMSGGNLYTKGEVAFFVNVPAETTVTFTVQAKGTHLENDWPLMSFTIDSIESMRVSVDSEESKAYEMTCKLSPAVHRLGVRLLNEAGGVFSRRTLYLENFSVVSGNNKVDLKFSDEEQWIKDGPTREKQTLDLAAQETRKLRTGAASLRILDEAQKPLPNTEVKVEQQRHAFLFGALLAGFSQYPTETANEEYRRRFEAIFNFATVPFYWQLFEPTKGQKKHHEAEAMIDWARDLGIAVKGHPLLWGHEAGIPQWSKGQPSTNDQRAFVEDTMKHYAGKVQFWEVVNEPVNQPEVKIMPAYEWARAADPTARLLINEYGIFYEGYPEFYTFIDQAINDQVPFDAIGIQAHAPTDMAFPLDRVWRTLDWYTQLGKPIHITEFTPPSKAAKLSGAVWRGEWSESVQAEYAEAFYRVCFAHPTVEAITWWDFADTGAWVPGGGMLREDRSPKPVYERLRKLIREEWHTEATLTTDPEGRINLEGYFGDYSLTAGGKKGTFTLTKGVDASKTSDVTLK